jgi:hypothetical protein
MKVSQASPCTSSAQPNTTEMLNLKDPQLSLTNKALQKVCRNSQAANCEPNKPAIISIKKTKGLQ